MTEFATTCDECHGSIACEETCYLVPTKETLDALPVVRVTCAACYHTPVKDGAT